MKNEGLIMTTENMNLIRASFGKRKKYILIIVAIVMFGQFLAAAVRMVASWPGELLKPPDPPPLSPGSGSDVTSTSVTSVRCQESPRRW